MKNLFSCLAFACDMYEIIPTEFLWVVPRFTCPAGAAERERGWVSSLYLLSPPVLESSGPSAGWDTGSARGRFPPSLLLRLGEGLGRHCSHLTLTHLRTLKRRWNLNCERPRERSVWLFVKLLSLLHSQVSRWL